jgi:hypothetical protein
MPAPTPEITLTFTLLDYQGNQLGDATNPAWLRVALCNFGSNIPRICGAGVIAEVSSWFVDIPYIGVQGTIDLWGNDQITPSGTYYAISVLDTNKNVVQTQLYYFDPGAPETIDLACATPFNPPNPPGIPQLELAACSGAVPGTVYTAPGVIVPGAVFYNGVQLRPGLSLPLVSYTQSGDSTITLNITTEAGDRVDALCIT